MTANICVFEFIEAVNAQPFLFHSSLLLTTFPASLSPLPLHPSCCSILLIPPSLMPFTSRVPTLYYSAGLHRDTVKSPISRIPYRVWHFPHIKRQILWLFLSVSVCMSLPVAPAFQYFCLSTLSLTFLPSQAEHTNQMFTMLIKVLIVQLHLWYRGEAGSKCVKLCITITASGLKWLLWILHTKTLWLYPNLACSDVETTSLSDVVKGAAEPLPTSVTRAGHGQRWSTHPTFYIFLYLLYSWG